MLPSVILDQDLIAHTIDVLGRDIFSITDPTPQTSKHTRRLTYEFGYSYKDLLAGDKTFKPIPEFLVNILAIARDSLEVVTGKSLPPIDAFNNLIISIYEADFQLQPHVDIDEQGRLWRKAKPEFYYGDDVIGIILIADSEGSLYLQESPDDINPRYDPNRAIPIKEQDGMVFLLTGEYRHHPWYHGTRKVRNLRLSLTGRTTHFIEP